MSPVAGDIGMSHASASFLSFRSCSLGVSSLADETTAGSNDGGVPSRASRNPDSTSGSKSKGTGMSMSGCIHCVSGTDLGSEVPGRAQ